MRYAVIRGEGYTLAHVPDFIQSNSVFSSLENKVDDKSEILKNLSKSLRSFEEAVRYLPHQVYIGEINPETLRHYDLPWYNKPVKNADRFGAHGEIMSQDEFIGVLKIADIFDLIKLEKEYVSHIKKQLTKHPLFNEMKLRRLKEGDSLENIQMHIDKMQAMPLKIGGQVVGCVKRAHEFDPNLTAEIFFENIITKASGMLTAWNLLDRNQIEASEIDYVIECSESAAGDVYQRGGGNFAKAIAEGIGAVNASGSDTRAFCAAPVHAIIEASALVQSGIYRNVLVVAGGASAKLAMNAREHLKHDMPVLEDVIAGFAVLVGENDGLNPIIRSDLAGKHTVSTGSSPQAVITSLITTPLEKGGLKLKDIDRYAVEMQNPDITKPAGAGDVPEANYKMIASLGVKRGEIDPKEVATFGETFGFLGWAPTQGHIPSGIPYIGHARSAILNNEITRVMIIGKGSLFLARLTNQFDGVSFVIEKNSGLLEDEEEKKLSEEDMRLIMAKMMRKFAEELLKETD
ncbi:glycine/sarcosine/betaine reductase complex component C subunit beta [Tindallia californiensis]|uniref:Betaine reductase n=1 Tax=Tindallia californiensis TaxID=159292 RepID=A0A1H3I8W8_9FIRM|nr:glycine/sarcosine/betaine reductase complex component C subunit beta [Tindallia californiensis]SDY24120.1 betaine reductase [Tindallia californiensis]